MNENLLTGLTFYGSVNIIGLVQSTFYPQKGNTYSRTHRCKMAILKINYRLMQVKNKLPFVIKTFVLSIFEWPFYTGFTILQNEAFILL